MNSGLKALWVFVLTALVFWLPTICSPLSAEADTDIGHIAVIETDPTILQPGELFDLNNQTITFTPRAVNGYTISAGPLNFDTNLGTNLGLGDDAFGQQNLAFTFPFFGVDRTSIFINSNGNLTFGSGSTLFHFNAGGSVNSLGTNVAAILDRIAASPGRIAVLWQDWNPAAGGGVFARSLADRLVITWSAVPLFGTTTTATFQVILFNSGVIQMNYQSVTTTPGGGYLVGVSPGSSIDARVTTVDFSQGTGTSLSSFPTVEPLVQVFGTSSAPLVHMSAAARRFYASHGDLFDNIAVFANFQHALGSAFAFLRFVRNNTSGIGLGTFNDSSFYGSSGRLQSVLNMNRLDLYPADPNTTFLGTNNTLDVMGQETGHQWLAFVDFDNGGVCSNLLLGRQLAHWSFFHDTDASDMEGNRWQDNGNGTFTSIEATARFSPLDQYMMGLRSTGEVPTFFFINNPTNTGGRTRESSPQIGVTVNGTRQNATVNQVITCEGARSPSSGFSGVNPATTWKQAFILLIQGSTTVPSADVTKIDTIRSAWVPYFNASTGGRGSVDTSLGGTTVTILATDPTATEAGPTTGIFTVSRTGPTTSSLTVFYAVGGSATNGTDYQNVPGSVTIPAGSSTAPITVTPIDDGLIEGDEAVMIQLQVNAAYNLGNPNSATVTIADNDAVPPDLIVSSLSAPSQSGAGFTISVKDTTKNQGTGAAAASATKLYLSPNSTWDSGDVLLGGRAVPGLGSGSSNSGTTQVPIPVGTATGTYYIIAKADADNGVFETNDGNNTRSRSIRIGPDLIVSSVSAPSITGAGLQISVTDSAKNQGGGSAGSSTTKFYLSTNNSFGSSDILLGSRAVGTLAPGETKSGSTPLTIPPGTATGTYYIIARADADNAVPETSESNNTKSSSSIKIGPDLIVSSLSAPGSGAAGSTISVTDGTKNQGGGSAGGSATKFYLSTNSSLGSSDILLGSRAVPGLGPGTTNSGSTLLTIPAGTASGSYRIVAQADGDNVVPETSNSNNTKASSSITIGP